MPDPTNLLDADEQALIQWTWGSIRRGVLVNKAYTALRDEIVRQAREGMVPRGALTDTLRARQEIASLEAENARLRAELETAKRVAEVTQSYTIGMQRLLEDLAAGRPLRTEGVEDTHVLSKAKKVADAMETAKREAFVEGALVAGDWTRREAESEARARYPAPAVADTGEREAACDQCGQPLREGDARDFDHKTTRHTIRGCIRALGVAMGGGK